MRICVVSQNCCVRASQTALAAKAAGHEVYLSVFVNAAKRQFNDRMDAVSVWFNKGQMLRSIERLQPDIVHVHDRPHTIASAIIDAKLGVPVVHDVHDMDSLLAMPSGPAQHEAFSLQKADGLVFVSEPYQKYAEHWFSPLPPTVVVPSATCEALMPQQRRPPIGAAVWEGGLYVKEPKDPRFYIDQRKIAATLLAQGQAVCIHPAPEGFPENGEQYSDMGATVFTPVAYESLLSHLTAYEFGWYGQGDTDSRQIHDTLPNKLFDYVAAGLPVLVVNAKEAARFVTENRLGVAIEKPEEFKRVKAELVALREGIWTRRKEFTRERYIKPLLALYDRLAGKKPLEAVAPPVAAARPSKNTFLVGA